MKLSATLCLLVAVAGPVDRSLAADPRYPDWPCAQAKVPEISLAAVWNGPALDDTASKWKDDVKVSALIPRLAKIFRSPFAKVFPRSSSLAYTPSRRSKFTVANPALTANGFPERVPAW